MCLMMCSASLMMLIACWKIHLKALSSLLTTAYTPERENLFKWAGPTSQSMYGIFDNGNFSCICIF